MRPPSPRARAAGTGAPLPLLLLLLLPALLPPQLLPDGRLIRLEQQAYEVQRGERELPVRLAAESVERRGAARRAGRRHQQRLAAVGAGEGVRAALLQPGAQAGQVEVVPARQLLGHLRQDARACSQGLR